MRNGNKTWPNFIHMIIEVSRTTCVHYQVYKAMTNIHCLDDT